MAPVYWLLILLLQILIDLDKMVAAKEASTGRERGGVGRLEHTVLLLVDEGPLLLSIGSPEQEHHTREIVVDPVNDSIGQSLPSLNKTAHYIHNRTVSS